MGKPSRFVMEMQAKAKMEREVQRTFSLQQMEDMAIITLADEFGFGPVRALRFRDSLREKLKDICWQAVRDAKDDTSIEYTKALIDRRLKKTLGDKFEPWEMRYAFGEGKIK